ncbi:hypothetical protein DLM75_19795 [Leptospira stimsonii]|uniref:Uncharacterized protein n=1 Tax=Leptospira stimsonii TaxID=2202203 RepID=A0A396YRL5_9LEPT|nr:hypothetical protein DLM75_19795 [Leptospira stimsonii]
MQDRALSYGQVRSLDPASIPTAEKHRSRNVKGEKVGTHTFKIEIPALVSFETCFTDKMVRELLKKQNHRTNQKTSDPLKRKSRNSHVLKKCAFQNYKELNLGLQKFS